MDLNSHDETHATGDQVSSQLSNATKDTHQTPEESLEWPEEVFKSLNVPTPGLQQMTAPPKLANNDDVKVKIKNPMTGKIEEKTCKVFSSHQHANGSWTYKLYDGPGSQICSDPNFLQYRGFKYLHSRVLSCLQYEIQQLEDELDRLDKWDDDQEDKERRLICLENDMLYQRCDQFPEEFQLDFERTRPEVLAELRPPDELMLKTREITLLQRPSTKDYRSVRSWFANHAPLVHGEAQYLKCREDIITLRPGRECAGFDGFVERMLHLLDVSLRKLDCHIVGELQEKTSDPRLQYYAPARVDKLVGFIITGVIFMLLILPVVALYELSNVGRRESPFEAIGILIIFTLLFAAAMSALTKATRQELFAASAAYCAVLVVFISNFITTQFMDIADFWAHAPPDDWFPNSRLASSADMVHN
ncbi:hypothetical protein D0865_05550 [Hortaea werneckii]|uniref:DUF6594 domain-containing protein n=1 Tax=Hortaea werneckii TaxID=91943 RepID=A0A3M7CLA5_HORWE|nr:hypothetical protein D0865_05550 [Hortaea werneckii]